MPEKDQQRRSSQLPNSFTVDAPTVAQRLHVTPATVNNWAKANTMPAYRVGRSWILFQAELDTWLANTRTDRSGDQPLPTLQEMTADLPPFLRLADVAQVLCVSVATATSLVTSQQLASVNLGAMRRIPREALTAYLAAARNSA